jgi:hypothetical protein
LITRRKWRMGKNPTVLELLKRTHGGTAAADAPGAFIDRNSLPEGKPNAGIAEVLEVLGTQLDKGAQADRSEWVFLLGSPGNGKSYQLVKFLEERGLIAAPKKATQSSKPILAERSPDLKGPLQSYLVAINDASIAKGKRSEVAGSLLEDLKDAFGRASSGTCHLLVNINRGILIEEREAKNIWAASPLRVQQLVNWLLGSESQKSPEIADVQICSDTEEDRDEPCSFLRIGRFSAPEVGALPVRIYAVLLDQLSLLEPTPAVSSGGSSNSASVRDIDSAEPKAGQYRVRSRGAADYEESRLSSPAATLLEESVSPKYWEESGCRTCPAACIQGAASEDESPVQSESGGEGGQAPFPVLPLCPFLANARLLRERDNRFGLAEVLRAAEIFAGKPHTYRDYWSIFCTSVVGRREDEWKQQHPCEWVVEQATAARQNQDCWGPRLRLAGHQLHHSLFPSPFPTELMEALGKVMDSTSDSFKNWEGSAKKAEEPPVIPTASAFKALDPVRDSATHWSTRVVDALEGVGWGQSPTKELAISPVGHGSPDFVPIKLSQLDVWLDDLLRGRPGETTTEAPLPWGGHSRSIIGWRAQSLLRQVAVANGKFAFDNVIAQWLELRSDPLDDDKGSQLREGIKRLVLPRFGDKPYCLLPAYRTLTQPIVGPQEVATYCCIIKSVDTKFFTYIQGRGDSLELKVEEKRRGGRHHEVLQTLLLDFVMCRQAIAYSTGAGRTELGEASMPRLERFHASLMREGGSSLELGIVKQAMRPL